MRGTADESRRDRAGGARFALPVAAVVGVLAIGSVALATARADRTVDTRTLARTAGAHRVTRARLSGGFPHVPCAEPTSADRLVRGLICEGPAPVDWREAPALRELARRGHTLSADSDTSGRRHFSGSWKLLMGDAEAAIAELREAARLDPSNAAVQSDLGTALLARAESEQDPSSLVDAFVAIDSALALDTLLPEARFNHALVLEWLQLRAGAIGAWRAYLELDRRSSWADEARSRLQQLDRPVASWSAAEPELQRALDEGSHDALSLVSRQFPYQVRDQTRGLVHQWARRRAAGDRAPDSLVTRALALGRALGVATGDAMWADVTQAIASAQTREDATHLDALAHGLMALERGDALYDLFDLDSAAALFGRARGLLATAGSALSQWAAYDLAKVDYQRNDYATALARLRGVIDSTPGDWLVLRGLALRTIGFVHYVRADLDAAVAAYTSAMDAGRILGEPVLELRAPTDAARLAATLRGESAAWEQLYEAFRSISRYEDTNGNAQHVFAAAAELSALRSPHLALLFQHESARLTAAGGQAVHMITAFTREARLLGRAGRSEEALRSLERVDAPMTALQNDSTRAVTRADVALVRAEVWLRQHPDSSIRLLKDVVARYRNTDYFLQLSRAQLLLAHAYAATGAVDSARSAFERALAETERQRSEIARAEERTHFLDQARPVIDSILRFLVQHDDARGALDFLEGMRSRVLLEQVRGGSSSGSSQSQGLEGLRKRLTEGTHVISYAVLDGELLTWLIRRDGTRMYRTPLAVDMNGQVERFKTLIARRSVDAEIRAIAAQLYQVLIAPMENELVPGARLVFVPDKWLHDVPFAALFDAQRERFLVQLHEVSVAPSVRLFEESAARFTALGARSPASVLAVGDPAFDQRAYALARLPAAREEAERVAASHQRSTLLMETAATPAAFLRAARSSAIIHFAGHGVVRPEAPLRSHLLLAPDPQSGAAGALYARDIFEVTLPRTRLAILSGCHTASGRLSYTEGASSLARAFFAAGVPAVIASLWAVADEETAEFFAQFHRDLARGDDPAAALRRTQIEWVSRAGGGWATLSTWAAFQLFGATGGLAQNARVKAN